MKKQILRLVNAAMLTAMAVVIGTFCKTFLNFNGLLRVTFENLPILVAGIFFGPIFGGVVGAASDLASYLLSPQTLSPNLIITLGAAMVGVVSGFVSHYIVKKQGYLRIVVSCLAAHLVGSMLIKSVGLFVFFSWGVLLRIPLYFVIAAIETGMICLMYKNKSFRAYMERL